MNIGFEAKRFFTNYTGLGNYSRFVVDALSTTYPQNDFFLYSPRVVDHPENRLIAQRKNVHIVAPGAFFSMPLMSALWRTWGVSRSASIKTIQIFHGLSQELPLGLPRHVKKVVTVHDLIFLRYPQFYNSVDVAIYTRKVKLACENADIVIAISQQTADDILKFLNLPDPSRITVVYQGCHPIFKKETTPLHLADVKKKYALPDQYMLSVGTIEERKNLLLVLGAMARIPAAERLPLVVVGRSTSYMERVTAFIRKHELSEHVVFLKNIEFSDLPAIYRQSRLFLYPSFFEGFGIPLVEAITSGVPVITSTGSCFEEAAGSGALYVDPNSADEMASAIQAVLMDSGTADKLREAGKMHIEKFEPAVIAHRLNDVYRSLVSEPVTVL